MSNRYEYILSPSVLASDYSKLGQEAIEVQEAGAQYLHLDVMDGMFVPSMSIGMPVIKSLRPVTDMVFDVHLMIEEPIRYIEEFKKAGADIITVHAEACKNVEETLEYIRNIGCKVGITIKPNTPVESIYPYINLVDMVLIMTVEPGFGGQKIIMSTLDKVRILRQYAENNNLHIDIEVDGGITLDNVNLAIEAGANVIVAGSAVFKGDKKNNVRQFMERFPN